MNQDTPDYGLLQPLQYDAKCGYECHSTVAAKDYIFTAYPKR
jgi:hypothetical protein